MAISGQVVQDILIAITVIGGSWGFYRLRKPSQDTDKRIETLTGLVEDYEKRIKFLEDKIKEDAQLHVDNARAISNLQGQIKVYKDLPLRELADGIKEVVKVSQQNADSNKEILHVLQQTSFINAEDRDVLTNQNKHIRTEVNKIIGDEGGNS
jgi:hypothetical protein